MLTFLSFFKKPEFFVFFPPFSALTKATARFEPFIPGLVVAALPPCQELSNKLIFCNLRMDPKS
jgi:hypothetical protein